MYPICLLKIRIVTDDRQKLLLNGRYLRVRLFSVLRFVSGNSSTHRTGKLYVSCIINLITSRFMRYFMKHIWKYRHICRFHPPWKQIGKWWICSAGIAYWIQFADLVNKSRYDHHATTTTLPAYSTLGIDPKGYVLLFY